MSELFIFILLAMIGMYNFYLLGLIIILFLILCGWVHNSKQINQTKRTRSKAFRVAPDY